MGHGNSAPEYAMEKVDCEDGEGGCDSLSAVVDLDTVFWLRSFGLDDRLDTFFGVLLGLSSRTVVKSEEVRESVVLIEEL